LDQYTTRGKTRITPVHCLRFHWVGPCQPPLMSMGGRGEGGGNKTEGQKQLWMAFFGGVSPNHAHGRKKHCKSPGEGKKKYQTTKRERKKRGSPEVKRGKEGRERASHREGKKKSGWHWGKRGGV